MSKKNPVEETQDETQTQTQDQDQDSSGLGALNFNVDDEYKPSPLCPKGTYHGAVTKVSFDDSSKCIVWSICLHDNGGVMSDGETPIDGSYVFYRNWLPKPGDEDLLTASGKFTKRQSKINMLADFAKSLSLDMSTPAKIAQALEEGEWIGTEVDVDIDIEEYQGKFSSKVSLGGMRKSTMY